MSGNVTARRKVTGMSAVLLPFLSDGTVDWAGFDGHVERTVKAGLVPAVNMDTGYVNLLDDKTRREVLSHTKDVVSGAEFVAGAYVGDNRGDKWNPGAYRERVEQINEFGGTPVIMQSFGLISQGNDEIVACYKQIGEFCERFIAFELGKMFARFGMIYDLDVYEGIMSIPQCIGAKHSSLNRKLEWQRLALRDRKRPDFKVLTGNDLAIDMIMYGSDYLLGLSTFAPEAFALRDRFWEQGHADFYDLSVLLQYLGMFVFREPVPAYKHSAAQFLHLRGWIASDTPHPKAATRPVGDIAVLEDILGRLKKWV